MHEITITKVFCAAHAIRLGDGTVEPIHGHNWELRVTVAAGQLDALDWVMDFHELERIVEAVIKQVHNRNLNEIGPFMTGPEPLNPTAERVAWWLAKEIAPGLPEGVSLVSVSVTEAPGCTATYQP